MPDTPVEWFMDLIARTEKAVASVAGQAAHTGAPFTIEDIVDAVERDLPEGYPTGTTLPGPSRRDAITRIAEDVVKDYMVDGDGPEPANP